MLPAQSDYAVSNLKVRNSVGDMEWSMTCIFFFFRYAPQL